jgi:two-component system chemotaxis response regulator CheY
MKTILVVDDAQTMLKSLRTTLELSGFQVETAIDGDVALTMIQSGLKPHLILTDINMPHMSGIDFIRHARQILRFTPILVVTTESQQARRDEARRLGASGWLLKPVGSAELLKVVQQFTAQAA